MLKRFLISMVVGTGITALPEVVIGALDFPVGRWSALLTTLAMVNYWPTWFLRPPFTRLDCPSADSIADKLDCMWISFAITTLIYSAAFFGVSTWSAKRKRQLSS